MKKETTKRPTALSKAKAEIKDLKGKLQALNVKLDDNIVTHEELKVLKIYKGISIVSVITVIVLLVKLFA